MVNELLRLLLAGELFPFVLPPEVESPNKLLERLRRGPALERTAGRTKQTAAGAPRRRVLVSVLEWLRANLEQFAVARVLDEVGRWLTAGKSLLARQGQAIQEGEPGTIPNRS